MKRGIFWLMVSMDIGYHSREGVVGGSTPSIAAGSRGWCYSYHDYLESRKEDQN